MTGVTKTTSRLGSLVLLLVVLSGCGPGNGTASGFVKYEDGEPVRSGSVEFRSIDNGTRYASRIAKDGAFTLTNQDGDPSCPPGDYEVVVVQIVLTEDLVAEAHEHGRTVPRRYADYYTSGLKVTKKEADESPLSVTLESGKSDETGET